MEVVYGFFLRSGGLPPSFGHGLANICPLQERMLLKGAGTMQEAKEAFRQREELEEREFQRQSHKIEAPTIRASRRDPPHVIEACSGSEAGVGVEPDPRRPLGGVGFGLSCERGPMAAGLTGGDGSTDPAWVKASLGWGTRALTLRG